ncbi:universal stress protein [Halogeometricum sp. S1BR25-6]|uniref:Universal stress protein n=1 Tax=Halogeometricum salsisoli TaxID=2950536 RepID=A0ABU2GIV8_9EURY|nr:universal stress protein [Halogeometricum sp. S1BR25-6]MDS0300351.1 universal stress protein [Halogeometricum sp. S1BR25-6]
MTTILLCADTDVERVTDQVESLTTLPLDPDRVRVVVYHVFRADGDAADARKLKSVGRATEALEAAGFEVAVEQSSGDAIEEILDAAEAFGADLLSLAGRRKSPTGKALFGSVAQRVALRSDRPVLFCSAASD